MLYAKKILTGVYIMHNTYGKGGTEKLENEDAGGSKKKSEYKFDKISSKTPQVCLALIYICQYFLLHVLYIT